MAICKANEMCNYLGLDSISTGATIAWAMEAYEKGLITLEDTDGQPMRFEHGDDVVAWIEKIATRDGYGDVLAEGSARVAAQLGMGSEEFLTTVKGVEMGMHDPRHMENMRETFMLAPTGGDHGSPTSDRNGLRNAVGICSFLAYDDDQTLDILRGRHRLGHRRRGDEDNLAPRSDARPAVQQPAGLHPRGRQAADPLRRGPPDAQGHVA